MPSILQAAFTSAALFVLALSSTTQSAAPPPAASTAPPAAAETAPSPECRGEFVTSKVDRFSGVASLTTKTPEDPYRLTPNLRAVSKGSLSLFTLALSEVSDGWRYMKCHTTNILADDKRVILGEAEFDGEVLHSGRVYEHIKVELSAAAVAQLGAAKKIEFKVCNDEFQASEEFVCAAHEFARKVVEQFGAKPAHP
jgi:hypothetical protein